MSSIEPPPALPPQQPPHSAYPAPPQPGGPGPGPGPWAGSHWPPHFRHAQPPMIGAPEHPRGQLVLTLGLLAVVGFHVLGPFAWAMGSRALREADVAPHPTANRGQLQWGRALGICGTAMLAVLGPLFTLLVLFPE